MAEHASAAVSFAKYRNIEREAVVDERSILRDALQRSMGTVPLNQIKTEFADRVAAGEFLQHDAKPGAAGRLFTTPEMVILEQDTIAAMLSGQNRHQELASAHTRAVVDVEHSSLYAGQRAAVRHILESRDTVTALEGVAGAGKTTALEAVRSAAEREGYRVAGLAPDVQGGPEARRGWDADADPATAPESLWAG